MLAKLMPHQKDAVEKLSNGKILYGGVGTGKSLTALAYYKEKVGPCDIYVITTARKRDSLEWEGEATKFLISTDRHYSMDKEQITIDSWNNISKYVDVEKAFFIFDEQRLVGNGAWVKSFFKIVKRNNWIMLSATPGDTWLDYVPVFIANGFYKNVTEFRREHVVYRPYSRYPQILRYIGEAVLEKYRNIVLVEMPFLKHTVRHLKNYPVAYDSVLYNKIVKDRWHIYEDRPLKDAGEMFRCMKQLVWSDPSRIDAILDLLEDHPKLIVYYNFDYELDILRTLSDQVHVSEWNGHRKQPVPTGDKWVYLVQYVSGAEAWNCVQTDAMVFYSMTYSYKNFEQSQGRIDRLNTSFKDLHYYILTSNSSIDKGVAKALSEKKMFNERTWAAEELGFFDVFDNGLAGV